MIGNFYELGPYWVDDNLDLQPNRGEGLRLASGLDQGRSMIVQLHHFTFVLYPWTPTA